jgi:hypothetical protein
MSEQRKPIAIWFFIGLLLLVYGVLILGVSLYNYLAGVQLHTVLANLHIGIWWGALLILIGLIYIYFFSPGRSKR